MKINLLIIVFIIPAIAFSQSLQKNKTINLPNDIKMEFVHIQPGNFLMGSSEDEFGHQSDEAPKREMRISKGFYLGMFEVKQNQWQAVMKHNPAVFRTFPEAENLPVEYVSWNDCQVFIRKLNELGIGKFRLPTEAEWEYACRAGTTTNYYWGNSMSEGGKSDYAWANSRSNGRTHPVGEKLPNSWGLYDMNGNVWEWCSDWYAPYQSDETIESKESDTNKMKAFRGGSWYDGYLAHRSANRHKHAPHERYTSIGLRLVMELD